MIRIYVPRDSSALALGADALAAAIAREAAARGVAIDLVRNGSRGLFWLESLVEVETPKGRIGYANVEADDAAALFDAIASGVFETTLDPATDPDFAHASFGRASDETGTRSSAVSDTFVAPGSDSAFSKTSTLAGVSGVVSDTSVAPGLTRAFSETSALAGVSGAASDTSAAPGLANASSEASVLASVSGATSDTFVAPGSTNASSEASALAGASGATSNTSVAPSSTGVPGKTNTLSGASGVVSRISAAPGLTNASSEASALAGVSSAVSDTFVALGSDSASSETSALSGVSGTASDTSAAPGSTSAPGKTSTLSGVSRAASDTAVAPGLTNAFSEASALASVSGEASDTSAAPGSTGAPSKISALSGVSSAASATVTAPGRFASASSVSGASGISSTFGTSSAPTTKTSLYARCTGVVDDIAYLRRQQRLTFARIGITDPLSIDDYVAHDGLAGLRHALASPRAALCDTLTDSGLRGRGGAAFPAGIKWRTVANAHADQKYVVCNADEGDSGTFADRLIMESDPFVLIEGMIIAGIATGASIGHIYVRSEYPHAVATLEAAIAHARAAGWLGARVLGSAHAFDLFVAKGAGAYVCGEETALLESLEGRRGIVRVKPPLPALAGLYGKPTVINNVITLATVPVIFARGAAFYRDFGMGRSRGTLPFQLAGNVRRGGLIELAFGVTLRELLFDYGGGAASARPVRAVQVGGPLGAYLPASQWDIPMDYETYAAAGVSIGHGGIVVHDDTSNLAELAQYAMAFCAHESCGKCTPCRIGSTRGVEVIERIRRGDTSEKQLGLLRDLCDTMLAGSLCAMGGMTPYPVLSALNHFPEDFGLKGSGLESSGPGESGPSSACGTENAQSTAAITATTA